MGYTAEPNLAGSSLRLADKEAVVDKTHRGPRTAQKVRCAYSIWLINRVDIFCPPRIFSTRRRLCFPNRLGKTV